MTQKQPRQIGPIGTIVRLLLAPTLIYFGFQSPIEDIVYPNEVFLFEGRWDDLILGIIVIPAVLVIWQLIRKRNNPQQLRALGSKGTIINAVITIALFYTPLHHAMWFYLGVSLFVAAIRGYAGCEVLAISNWITKRNDQVGCVILFPIDGLEKKAK